jgi:hypothetical protein
MPTRITVRCVSHAMIAMVCTKIHAYAGHQKKTDTPIVQRGE